jgi:phosphoglycolate phosphatase
MALGAGRVCECATIRVMGSAARVIVFDLDGCILDSTEPIFRCLNAALVEHGLDPIAPGALARHVGPPLQVTIAEMLDERGADPGLVDVLVTAYRERYRTESLRLAVTYPGVVELLDELAPVERLAVCTSKPSRWAVPILEHLGLAGQFERIAGPSLTEAEPKTTTLARVLEELAPVDRAASVMIGDRHHDVDAAIAHDVVPIGVTWGFGTRDELESAGARSIVDHPSELPRLLADLG